MRQFKLMKNKFLILVSIPLVIAGGYEDSFMPSTYSAGEISEVRCRNNKKKTRSDKM
jgi:hypothetical protein